MKKCPICKEVKPHDQYHSYWSKERKTTRIGNYCKPCARENSRKRAKEYFEEHKDERLQYAKEYRKKNKDKIRVQRRKFEVKYRKELQDCYAAEMCSKMLKCTIAEVREHPEILEAWKANVKLKRKIRCHETH
jgi:DNA polymerase II small subunit/DNA polymerase delta subunit B